MQKERRNHKRFSATAFLNMPVHLSPLPPYFGHTLKGRLIDLSAGGIAISIDELIPQGTFLNLKITFPDHSVIESVVSAKHVLPRGRHFLHGFEFLTVPSAIAERIEQMSTDYINCESRIQNNMEDICRTDCAFFKMCNKKEKMDPVVDMDRTIDLAFKELKDYAPASSPTEAAPFQADPVQAEPVQAEPVPFNPIEADPVPNEESRTS